MPLIRNVDFGRGRAQTFGGGTRAPPHSSRWLRGCLSVNGLRAIPSTSLFRILNSKSVPCLSHWRSSRQTSAVCVCLISAKPRTFRVAPAAAAAAATTHLLHHLAITNNNTSLSAINKGFITRLMRCGYLPQA